MILKRLLRLAKLPLAGLALFTAMLAPAATAGQPPAQAGAAKTIGVLVLAHGGTPRWNAVVEQAVADAALPYPTRVAFGMGMHGGEVEALQQAVTELEHLGVEKVVAVPLLVSSASEVMRQYAYLLGLRPDGPWQEQAEPVKRQVPIRLTSPLDGDPAVAQVLLDRAREVSVAPGHEVVVVIAHGPNTEEDNARWLDAMGRLTQTIKAEGGFKDVLSVTMRDDAEPAVLAKAVADMRQTIEAQAKENTVIVLPLLIANGGIEGKIPERLSGLTFIYQPKALLPHPKLSEWIASRVQDAVKNPG